MLRHFQALFKTQRQKMTGKGEKPQVRTGPGAGCCKVLQTDGTDVFLKVSSSSAKKQNVKLLDKIQF